MAKTKTTFYCQSCGYQSPKWLGKCPVCQEWNTFNEEVVQQDSKQSNTWRSSGEAKKNTPKPIHEISFSEEQRIITHDSELNRVLGGGIVNGSVVLIGGDPGIGKSTLMLQIALNLDKEKVLYISGEESEQQIKMRGERLSFDMHGTMKTGNCYVYTETETRHIFKTIEQTEPGIVVVDSIQTLHSSKLDSGAGSVSQVKQCTAELLQFAKETGTPVLLIGHINKEGSLAGPKVLEHMVDTVLQFEGDRHMVYRILRTIKNRFGSTSELGIYEMQSTGLREVDNPSEILISQRAESLSGVAIGTTLEGNRPLLIEIQALVSPATYGTPQRSSTGFDNKRLNMLLAVLEKRVGLKLGIQDVFLNVAGGLKIEDPAIDLAVAAALVSSYQDIPVPAYTCFAAEVGLGGEIRAVNKIEQRIIEAEKLGFKEIYVSQLNLKGINKGDYAISIQSVQKLGEVFEHLFG